jgi:hypothetical protein
MGSLWFGGVLVFVCVELAAAKEAHLVRQRTRPVAGLWRVGYKMAPDKTGAVKQPPARVAQHNALVTRCLREF